MNTNQVQLYMRKNNMENLPPIYLPSGFGLHAHVNGEEKTWEDIIKKAFGSYFSFDFLKNGCDYYPEYTLYVSKNGEDVSTATAIENKDFPGEGWIRMVATVPEGRRGGAGRLVVLAALHSLKHRGYKSVVLSTDEHRIAAIKLYLSLGFEPICLHESHAESWNIIRSIMKQKDN